MIITLAFSDKIRDNNLQSWCAKGVTFALNIKTNTKSAPGGRATAKKSSSSSNRGELLLYSHSYKTWGYSSVD